MVEEARQRLKQAEEDYYWAYEHRLVPQVRGKRNPDERSNAVKRWKPSDPVGDAVVQTEAQRQRILWAGRHFQEALEHMREANELVATTANTLEVLVRPGPERPDPPEQPDPPISRAEYKERLANQERHFRQFRQFEE